MVLEARAERAAAVLEGKAIRRLVGEPDDEAGRKELAHPVGVVLLGDEELKTLAKAALSSSTRTRPRCSSVSSMPSSTRSPERGRQASVGMNCWARGALVSATV